MPRNTKRRQFLKYAGVGTTVGLAGCTRGGSTGSSTTSDDSGQGSSGSDLPVDVSAYEEADIDWTQFEGTQINIGAVNHAWVKNVKPLVPVFEELTGIDVVWNILPEQKFRTKRLTDVSTGAGKFDLFFMDQVVNQFRESGWLQPLDPYFADDSLFDEDWYDTNDLLSICREFAHGAGRADTWTGLPITVEVLTTFYRTDLYEKHGLSVPKTTDELRQNAKVIHENEDGVVGGVGRGQKGYGMNVYIMNGWIREWGKTLWENFPTDSALDSAAAVDAGQYYVNLLQNYGPESVASMTWSDVLTTMQEGQAGHIVADANLFWGSLTDGSASSVADDIGIAKMPVPSGDGARFAPNAFSWQVSTSKAAKNSKAGFLFLVWATSKPTQRYMGVERAAPFMTRESVWSSSDYQNAVGTNFAQTSLESLKNAIGDPFDPKYPEWAQEYSVELQSAIAGSQSVEEAFENAAQQAEQIAGSK